MNEHLFRKAALDRIASAEHLDKLPSIYLSGKLLLILGLGFLLVGGGIGCVLLLLARAPL